MYDGLAISSAGKIVEELDTSHSQHRNLLECIISSNDWLGHSPTLMLLLQ